MQLIKIFNQPSYLKYFSNIGWLVGERVLALIINLIVSALVVRYLGPERFGFLGFSLSVVALFTIFSNLGLDSIVVREIIKYPDQRAKLLGTSFILKLFGSILSVLILFIAIHFVSISEIEKTMIVVIGLGLVFSACNVIDFDFQAQIKSCYVVHAKLFQLISSAVIKLALISLQAPLIFFAAAAFLDALLFAIGIVLNYLRISNRFDGYPLLRSWRYSPQTAHHLLASSWPLFFSGIAMSVYMRIDQVMLRIMLNTTELGYYSAAVRIGESWLFFAVAITASLFPAILDARNLSEHLYLKCLQQFYNLMLWLSLSIAALIWMYSDTIVYVLLGEAFAPASPVLGTYAWSGVCVFMVTASSRWYIIEGYENAIMLRAMFGAALNVSLNLILIPTEGILGAAIATLISYALMAFFYDFIDRRGRPSFYLKCKSFLVPFFAVAGRLK
jgi:O-antigen/teichoic acid export membrane protein